MSDETHQQLSAFIDGELDPAAGRFLLRRLAHEQALAEQWQRWHLIRDCLQGQRITPLRSDFGQRVAAAIAAEAAPRRGQPGWLRLAGGIAIAASVALAALLAVPGSGPTPSPAPAEPTLAAEVVPSGVSERDLRPNLAPVTHTVSAFESMPLSPSMQVDPAVEAWLLRHDAALRGAGQDNFMPLMPVVSPPRQWTMVPAEPAERR